MAAGNELLEQMASPENLLGAWRAVRGNVPARRRGRSAGADKVSLVEFEQDLAANLAALRHSLIHQTYQPQPPLRISIPKPNGAQRGISILSVVDRVAQRAAQQALEPVWEPVFLPCSFGFRPGRSTQDAVKRVLEGRQRGSAWIVDGDISACFESLNHDLLLANLKRKVSDERFLATIQQWLEAGHFEAMGQQKEESPVAARMNSLAAKARQGLEWAARWLDKPYDSQYVTASERGDWDDEKWDHYIRQPPLELAGRDFQQQQQSQFPPEALRQMVKNGAWLAAGWARPAAYSLKTALVSAVQSQESRRLLLHGAIATGGVAGVAAGVAVTAYLLYRRSKPVSLGVMQGSPLSPLLANIYLHPFDHHITHKGLQLTRYADDWVIQCKTEEEAQRAYNTAVVVLNHLRLKLNREKTHILSPGSPFNWLGTRFD